MPWKNVRPAVKPICRALPLLIALLLFAGCAKKPWSDPLEGPELKNAAAQIDALADGDALCGKTLEGDLILVYESPLQKRSLSGFLQFSMPGSYKFIMTNPFGQPVLALAGDQKAFQAINTLEQKYLAGSLRSFGLRNKIPAALIKGDWWSWLTGRNSHRSGELSEIRADREGRGIWLTYKATAQGDISHLLFDPERQVYTLRIIDDANGHGVARISYGNWLDLGNCRQPQDIDIDALHYGTNIHLSLTNLALTNEQKTYRLKRPSGYLQQYMP